MAIDKTVMMKLHFICADRTEANSTIGQVETYATNNGGSSTFNLSFDGTEYRLHMGVVISVANINEAVGHETTLNNAIPTLPTMIPNTMHFVYDSKEIPDPEPE